MKSKFWKIYFALFSLLFIFFLTPPYFEFFPNWTLRDIWNVVLIPFSIFALYSYVFRKKFLTYEKWKIIFWIFIIDSILDVIYLFGYLDDNFIFYTLFNSNYPQEPFEESIGIYILTMFLILIPILPFFYALFRLGYPKPAKPALDWVILITDKYEESVKFYKDILGFKVKKQIIEDEFCQFALKSCKLAIYGRSQMEKLVGKKYLAKPGGAVYAFPESDDVDKQYEELKAKGVKFIKDPETQPWGQRTAYFTDPDGHIWEIQQWVRS